MHYRRLGRSGLKVSEISLGAWITFGNQIDEKTASDLIHAAYDQGVNYFDNADAYAMGQAEIVMGKAIADLPRPALVISSKVFWPTLPGPNGRGLSRKHITESLHLSLKRLDLDYVDLYFCHRYDPDTPVDEVVFTMNDLIRQGKILYWGTSEWEAAQIAQAVGVARQYNLIPPTMEQPQYNLFHRRRVEIELAPICREYGIGLTTWSPLLTSTDPSARIVDKTITRAVIPELLVCRPLTSREVYGVFFRPSIRNMDRPGHFSDPGPRLPCGPSVACPPA
mgnify:CR=1 FL=1